MPRVLSSSLVKTPTLQSQFVSERMESIETFVLGKAGEKKSNFITFSFIGKFCKFLARLGVGQGLINMFSDVLQENIFESRVTSRAKMNEWVYNALLQKIFLGMDKRAFVGAGAIPAPVLRSYKSRFLGADKGARPCKCIFRGRSRHQPPLKTHFQGPIMPWPQGAADALSRAL